MIELNKLKWFDLPSLVVGGNPSEQASLSAHNSSLPTILARWVNNYNITR